MSLDGFIAWGPGALSFSAVELYAKCIHVIKHGIKLRGDSQKEDFAQLFFRTRLFEIPKRVVQNLLDHSQDDIFDLLNIDPSLPTQQKHVLVSQELFGEGKETQSRIVGELLHEYYEHASMPEHLPFDNFFITFEGGISVHENKFDDGKLSKDIYQIAGILITHHNVICISIEPDDILGIEELFDGNIWQANTAVLVKIILDTIGLINSFRTYVIEQPRNMKYKMVFNKSIKQYNIKHRAPPPPFYTITLSDKILNDRYISKSRNRIAASYRWDVSGHERIRYQRGDMPISNDIEDTLIKRGYKIFKDNDPKEYEIELLNRRNVLPKKANEWFAMKISWVSPHINGPKSAPYIPALRKLPDSA